MTNIQQLHLLEPKAFYTQIKSALSHPMHDYIDYPAWLDSTDHHIEDFIKILGTCRVLPSEMELICAGCKNDTERDLYSQNNARPMLILDNNAHIGVMQERTFYILTDENKTEFLTAPTNCVINVNLYNKEASTGE